MTDRGPLPTPDSPPVFPWPEFSADRWLTQDVEHSGGLWVAFEHWLGIASDGSGSVYIGEEIGSLLVSILANGGLPQGWWEATIAESEHDETYVELVAKLARNFDLLELNFSITGAYLTETGRAWAELFTLDRTGSRVDWERFYSFENRLFRELDGI